MSLYQRLLVIICTFVLSVMNIQSETVIRENISAISFNVQNSPFIVESDIFIPPGKIVEIEKGCVFLFKPFTGLTIYGSLTVKGTVDARVVFTTINDTVFMPHSIQPPEPFAWNGITISKNAVDVSLHYFDICYPVYGIKSQKASVVIENGRFHAVGQYLLTIDEQVMNIDDSIPFYYNMQSNNIKLDSLDLRDKSGKKSKLRKKSFKYLPEILLLTAGLGGAGAGTYFLNQSNNNVLKYNEPPGNYTASERGLFKKESESKMNNSYLSYGGGAVCAVGAIAFAVVHHKDLKKLKKVAVSGWYADKAGTVLFTYRF